MSRFEPLHLADAARNVRRVAVRPGEDVHRVTVDDDEHEVACRTVRRFAGGAELLLPWEGRLRRAVVVRRGDRVWVALDGRTHVFTVRRGVPTGGAAGAAGAIDPFAESPMTGVVLDVRVAEGERVDADAPLLVIEAMKMEFVVAAPVAVEIDEVLVATGDRVDIGQHLVRFTPVVEPADDES